MSFIHSCWSCAHTTERHTPIYRSHRCEQCFAPGHCCRGCRFYDPNASKECREPVAEYVYDKEKPNFCDYFQAAGPSSNDAEDPAALARAKLEALFK